MITTLTESPLEAARIVNAGGLVAFPTETVYGLGADIFNAEAVERIFEAKKRPGDNPLIAHVGEIETIDLLASKVPDYARTLIEKFFPGPLTLVLSKRPEVPLIATAGLDSIGVRMPRQELARAFLSACGAPVAAPSANLSGRPSPTTWQAVYEDLNGRIDCILQGNPTEIGLESTVVDCTGDGPVLLRQGSISLEEIRRAVNSIVLNTSSEGESKSPGLRHKHYAPNADVLIVGPETRIEDPASSAYIGLSDREEAFAAEKIVADAEEYAQHLFEFFRECEREGLRRIYCERVDETGIGSALMDRIRRASQR